MSVTKENVVTLVIITLVVIGVAFYAWSVVQDKQIEALNNSEAGVSLSSDDKEPSYTDLDGNPVALSDYVGEVLVVNSWASWCPFCGTELEELSSVAAEYNNENIKIVAINRAEPSTTAQRFLRSVGTTSEIFLVLDSGDRYYRSIEGYTMPETVFYDRAGNIIEHHHGDMTLSQMREYINKAIVRSEAEEN